MRAIGRLGTLSATWSLTLFGRDGCDRWNWKSRQGQRATKRLHRVLLVLWAALVITACGIGEDGDVNLLLLDEHGDLYAVPMGVELDLDHRVARDIGDHFYTINEYLDGERYSNIQSNIRVADGWYILQSSRPSSGGSIYSAWATDGRKQELLASSFGEDKSGDVQIVDGLLFVLEPRSEMSRCLRGSPDDLDVVFRGKECHITSDGYVLGIDQLADTLFRAEVFSPEGSDDKLFSGEFDSIPNLSDNGDFLVTVDHYGVKVTHVQTGREVWQLSDGIAAEVSSHTEGTTVVAAKGADGAVVLAGFEHDGEHQKLTEVYDGRITWGFAENGDLYWTEVGGLFGTLFLWEVSAREVRRIDGGTNLTYMDTYGNDAVTAISDDMRVEFRRCTRSGVCRKLDAVQVQPGSDWYRPDRYWLDGDYIVFDVSEKAGLIPLNGGTATEVATHNYDSARVIAHDDGVVALSARHGFFDSLVIMESGKNHVVGHGRYDSILSARILNDTVVLHVRDDDLARTHLYHISSGKQRENVPEYGGYELIDTSPNGGLRGSIRKPSWRWSLAAGDSSEPATYRSSRSNTVARLAEEDQPAEAAIPDTAPAPRSQATPTFPAPESTAPMDGTLHAALRGSDAPIIRLPERDGLKVQPVDIVLEGILDENQQPDFYILDVPDEPRSSWGILLTESAFDTVIEAFKITPSDELIFVAEDDDSGVGLNASITLQYHGGRYLVAVRGYTDADTGQYLFRVTR